MENEKKVDIIKYRAGLGLCPICKCDTPMYEETQDLYVQVEYKGKKVTICKKHRRP